VDVSPLCLPGSLKFRDVSHKTAYISGFGRNHYAIAGKKAQCSTNLFLPRPFHTCLGNCNSGSPPQTDFEEAVCSWAIYNKHKDIEKLRVDVIRLVIEGRQRSVVCYPNVSPWGWCSVDESVSHDDFDMMPTWGACKIHCDVGTDRAGVFNFMTDQGTSYWAKQTLLPEHKCLHFLHGMKGNFDIHHFDPATEICAAEVHEPMLKEFIIKNLIISRKNISGQITAVEYSKFGLPSYVGGIDSCHGDSGGPIWRWQVTDTDPPEERVVQIGIISRGDRCARVNRPGIYTNIEHYREWINQETQDGECDSFQ